MNETAGMSEFIILYVDDEPQALKYFSRAFGNDFRVVTASSASAAKALIEATTDEIAVVISDQRMPGQTGASFLSGLRETHPGIVRMMTTAYSDLENAIEAVNSGEVFRYILKPWSLTSLKHDLATGIRIYALSRERDSLLAEKLGVRQSMRAVDRAKLLIGVVGALAETPTALAGVCRYIQDIAALSRTVPPAAMRDGELWADAEADTLLARQIGQDLRAMSRTQARSAARSDAAETGGELQALDGLRVGADMAAQMKQQADAAQGATMSLVYYLISGLCDYVTDGAVSVTDASGGTGKRVAVTAETLSLARDPLFGGAAPPRGSASTVSSLLLRAYIAAADAGHAVSATKAGAGVVFSLDLSRKEPGPVAEDARLIRETFQSFEQWG